MTNFVNLLQNNLFLINKRYLFLKFFKVSYVIFSLLLLRLTPSMPLTCQIYGLLFFNYYYVCTHTDTHTQKLINSLLSPLRIAHMYMCNHLELDNLSQGSSMEKTESLSQQPSINCLQLFIQAQGHVRFPSPMMAC